MLSDTGHMNELVMRSLYERYPYIRMIFCLFIRGGIRSILCDGEISNLCIDVLTEQINIYQIVAGHGYLIGVAFISSFYGIDGFIIKLEQIGKLLFAQLKTVIDNRHICLLVGNNAGGRNIDTDIPYCYAAVCVLGQTT